MLSVFEKRSEYKMAVSILPNIWLSVFTIYYNLTALIPDRGLYEFA